MTRAEIIAIQEHLEIPQAWRKFAGPTPIEQEHLVEIRAPHVGLTLRGTIDMRISTTGTYVTVTYGDSMDQVVTLMNERMSVEAGVPEMTYSEAIREGSRHSVQGFGMFIKGGRLCVNMAALKAVGGIDIGISFPWALKDAKCPVCGNVNAVITVAAECLNDHHKWTRESIADWIESLERTVDRPAIVHPPDANIPW